MVFHQRRFRSDITGSGTVQDDPPISRWRAYVLWYYSIGYTADEIADLLQCHPQLVRIQISVWKLK